ncbi:MAG: hypothetical protein FWG84_10715 [Bacteroidales bacterium]|nr:hypothetical protein [Bacteroidales bacterium]
MTLRVCKKGRGNECGGEAAALIPQLSALKQAVISTEGRNLLRQMQLDSVGFTGYVRYLSVIIYCFMIIMEISK